MSTEYDVLVKCFRAQLKKAEEEFRWVTTPTSQTAKTRERYEDAPDQVE
jgi:hypothetical protein